MTSDIKQYAFDHGSLCQGHNTHSTCTYSSFRLHALAEPGMNEHAEPGQHITLLCCKSWRLQKATSRKLAQVQTHMP